MLPVHVGLEAHHVLLPGYTQAPDESHDVAPHVPVVTHAVAQQ